MSFLECVLNLIIISMHVSEFSLINRMGEVAFDLGYQYKKLSWRGALSIHPIESQEYPSMQALKIIYVFVAWTLRYF